MSNNTRNPYVDMWRWDNERHLIETNDSKVAERISKWAFASNGPSFGVNTYMRQFFIPAKKASLARKLLGVEHVKNPNSPTSATGS